MKFFLTILLAAFALSGATYAQSTAQVKTAVTDIFGPTNQPVEQPIATLSRALFGPKHQLVVKTDTSGGLVFEGATPDAFETTFVITDPTADRTITFPNDTGTVALNPLAGTLTFEGATADAHETVLSATDPTADVSYALPVAAAGTYGLVTSTLAANGIDSANAVWGGTNQFIFEGATADAFETIVTPTDATADRTVTLPNASGTVHLAQASTTTALTADDQAVTPGANTVLQLTSDNATATNRTFTLSATGAITGQIYVLIGPATNQCEIADTGIQVLSATWSPTTGDTLTLLFDGTNFTEIARSNN